VRFQKVFYRYVTTAAAPATVQLGADSAPTTVYGTNGTPPSSPNTAPAPNVDNILFTTHHGASSPNPVQQIAVCMVGPTGAASQTAAIYVWDAGTLHWYQCGTTSPTLVQNQTIVFPAYSLCEAPQNNLQGSGSPGGVQQPTQGGAAYMLVVAASTPTAGQYLFAMTPILSSFGGALSA
jgi:hypothetical protein